MKKNFKSLFLIFFVAVLLNFLVPGKITEARSYEIDEYNVIYEVKDNTDVDIVENVTYDFSGQYNGVYRSIDTQGSTGIENIKVFVIRDGKEEEIPLRTYGNFDESSYEILNEGRIKKIKVYEQSNSVTKTIVYKYTLKSLAEKYNDTGTLNRKIVDANWEVPLNMVKATIKIPDGGKKEDFKIFSYGDLRGYDEIVDNRTFTLQQPELQPGDTIETQILFPKELLKNAVNVKNESILPSVLQRGARLANDANATRDEAKRQVEDYNKRKEKEKQAIEFGEKLSPFAIGAGILGIIGSIFTIFKYGRNRKPKFQGDYYRELPEDYSPAIMAYLMYNGQTQSKEIMATLLDLARKNVISIEEVKGSTKNIFGMTKDDSDFIIKAKNNPNNMELMEHEKFLYSWFINELGRGGELSLDGLSQNMKKRSFGINFARNFSSFKNIIQDEVANYGFWEANNLKGIFPFVLLTLLIGGFGAFLMFILYNVLGLIPLIIAGLSLFVILGLAVAKKLTEKGVEHKAMWSAFKKFLLDFSNLKDSEIPALSVWKHYLVYATSLGIAKEVMDQLPKVYPREELEMEMNRGGGFYPVFYNSDGFYRMDNAINRSVNQAFDAVRAQQIANSMRSSSSGSGGGFSSGSSGGSGGGGGGGAF